MIILGIYSGHDAHCCLVQDGVLTHHYHVDRYTRTKHTAGFHEWILDRMFADAGVTWQDVDAVASGGNRWDKEQATTGLFDALRVADKSFLRLNGARSPDTVAHYADPMERVTVDEVTHDGHTVKVYQVDHHLAHAAQAHFTGPYRRSMATTFDGGGDGAFMLTALCDGNRLSELEYNAGHVHPDRPSIGNLWTHTVTELYKISGGGTDGEGKVMGHAAYGTPRAEYVDAIDAMVRHGYGKGTIPAEFDRLKGEINFGDFRSADLKDYSASLQHVTERTMMEVVTDRVTYLGVDQITLSGGCVYNCCANGKLAERFPEIFVSNSPHDGGLGVGAALFVWHHVMGNEFNGAPMFDPCKGTDDAGYAEWGQNADQVVDDLLAGKLVAWYNGPSENGNRALGHRSILADPRLPGVRDLINERVKQREWYRPFAPSVLAGYDEWAAVPVPSSYYMSFTVPMKPEYAARVPGVVHVDGTCRPHIVVQGEDPAYWEIIDRFRQATGVPMVLNTSFNVQEPIVETVDHARATFARSGLDVLYIAGERYATA